MPNILYKGRLVNAPYPEPATSPVSISTTNLFAAYSVNRRIVSGYSGNILRGILFDGVNRTTFDIGQSSGLLAVASIPVNTFFIPTQIYDQSGNNNHLVIDRRTNINSIHSLSYLSGIYVINATTTSFAMTTNWSDSSPVCVYRNGDTVFGRGQDGFGAWSWLFASGSYVSITQSPNQAYTTSFVSAVKALGYTDFANTTQGILTAGQSLSTTIPNSLFRNSSVRVLSNFSNGTISSGYFSEFVVYTSALNSTLRQSLFDTLSA